jgi:putative ABC transport system permease protein
MKTSFYLHYAVRSLLRGGQRSLLAVFCVTAGVMAIVALQLVGFMLQHSLAASARDATGGDIAVSAVGAPLKSADLAFFAQLKQEGTINGYTALIGSSGALSNMTSAPQTFTVEAVDPGNFPLVSPPTFVVPSTGSLSGLLSNGRVVVTQQFLTLYQKQLHDRFPIYIKSVTGTGETLTVTIAGVIANSGSFTQAGNLVLISQHDYLAADPTNLAHYTLVDVTTADQAHTSAALKAINDHFPLVSTQTASDLYKSQQSSIDEISQFLKIAGLLALLIGGVGIVNTMQVLLSRRRTEIAMLKTAGYRRRDLYLLFGLEAGLLGLCGGILGALASIGISYLIRNLLQSLGTSIPFMLNGGLLLGSTAIGCATALIFGLLPIAQAANIRPLNVLREIEVHSRGGRIVTIALLALLSLLFCVLASVILDNDYVLGISTTYGTFGFLLVLSGIFSLLVLLVSKLPVTEGLHLTQILLVLAGVALSLLTLQVLPVFSAMLLILALFGLLVPWLPRSWKVNVKMALRNIGRRRARTTATLLAIFIGVYGVGLDIGLGQDLQTRVTSVLNQAQPYNLVVTTSGRNSTTLAAHLSSISGLSASRINSFTQALPLEINGRPAQQQMPSGDYGQQDRAMLGGIEGFDLLHNHPTQTIIAGRNLNASDNGTNHIIVSAIMTHVGWAAMNLKPGDTVTFASLDGRTTRTARIVGVFSIGTSYQSLGKVLAPTSFVETLNPVSATQTAVFYLKVPDAQVTTALRQINRIVPSASAQNITDGALSFLQVVQNITDILLAIALLALFAGVIIIANSVALAMLERRRELGILKAVGYTARGILSQIMIETAIVSGIGSFIATLLAAGAVVVFSRTLFNNNLVLNMEPAVVLGLVIVPVALAIGTAALVAWNAVRVRPLIVLRYE